MNAFDCYGDGLELFSREDTRESVFDQIRRQVEDCDYLQGLQILADDLSGFGHVCREVLLHVREEVTETKPLVVVGSRNQFAQDYVKSGTVIGLGTGSTAAYAVERVGDKLASGELTDIIAILLIEQKMF